MLFLKKIFEKFWFEKENKIFLDWNELNWTTSAAGFFPTSELHPNEVNQAQKNLASF